MQKKDGIVLRKIHGLFYLIDIKSNYFNDKCFLYELNEVGAFLWENIDGCKTIEELAHKLYEQITDDIDESIIVNDVDEYIGNLKKEGFII